MKLTVKRQTTCNVSNMYLIDNVGSCTKEKEGMPLFEKGNLALVDYDVLGSAGIAAPSASTSGPS